MTQNKYLLLLCTALTLNVSGFVFADDVLIISEKDQSEIRVSTDTFEQKTCFTIGCF